MKKNIKTNLKLAAVCSAAAMTLSGCVKHTNVIEGVSTDKILVRDITDGRERVIEFRPDRHGNTYYATQLKNSCVGDTVVFKHVDCYIYEQTKYLINHQDGNVIFDNQLLNKRQKQAEFDSLKCAIVRENQGKQR